MTRLKKQLIRKTTSNDRIRRIKDQKKIVNSKTSTKISEFHVKRLLENVEQQAAIEEATILFTETNNNVGITNDGISNDGASHINHINNQMADTDEKEATPVIANEEPATSNEPVKDTTEENSDGTPGKPEEEMNDFELVGLSPESQKRTTNVQESESVDEAKNDLKEELESEVTGNVDSEDDEEPNRRRKSNEDADSEGERDYSDVETEDVESEESDHHSASENDERSDRQSGNEEGEKKEEGEEVKSPTFVPRRTGFWDHDDRFSDIRVQESREPPQGSKKLWDKSEVDRWHHDKYIEVEQGPKEHWEVEQSMKDFEEGRRNRRSGDRPRGERKFGDFVQNGSRGRPRGRGGRRSGDYRQNRSYDDEDHPEERPSQDYRINSKNKEEDWPSINQKQYNNNRNNRYDNRRRNNDKEDWGGAKEGDEDWGGEQDIERKPNKRRDRSSKDQEYPYRNSRNNGQRSHRNEGGDSREYDRKDISEEKQIRRRDKRRSHENDDNWQPQQRADEYPRKSDSSYKSKGKGRGRGRGRQNEGNDNYPPPGENEKSNREKRIESLPPRLRDKAREKIVHDRNKGQHQEDGRDEPEPGQFEEQSMASNERQEDDGGTRDKPKRYSSQRQKTGASLMDIPSQIPESEEARLYMEQLNYLQQQMSPDKNVRALEQQILHLQSQLQQQLNLRTMPMMAQPNMGMQMPNMVSPMVPGVEQVYGADSSMYNMAQTMLPNTGGGDAMGLLNPQINPMILNQILAAAQQQQQQPGGLYLPPQQQQLHPQSPPSQQQTAQQLSEAESRKSRPAAIPIKPPPGLNHR